MQESTRNLAAALAHEWGDVLWPDRTVALNDVLSGSASWATAGVLVSSFPARAAAAVAPFLGGAESVLEVGAACGRFAYELARLIDPDAALELVEPEPTKVAWAEALLRGGAGSLAVDGTTTPYGLEPCRCEFSIKNDVFRGGEGRRHDAVVCLNVLDHLPTPRRWLRALGEAVEPGGILVLAAPFDWHDAITPVAEQFADWSEGISALAGSWQELHRADCDYPWRSVPRRLVLFSSSMVVLRRGG